MWPMSECMHLKDLYKFVKKNGFRFYISVANWEKENTFLLQKYPDGEVLRKIIFTELFHL